MEEIGFNKKAANEILRSIYKIENEQKIIAHIFSNLEHLDRNSQTIFEIMVSLNEAIQKSKLLRRVEPKED